MKKYKRFTKPIFCPHASISGYGKHSVSMGDLILYKETIDNEGNTRTRLGRVLALVTHDGIGSEYREPARQRGKGTRAAPRLHVLACNETFSHAYPRHVAIGDVVEIRTPQDDGIFIRWFFLGTMPSPETADAAASYGSLSDSYFKKYADANGNLRADFQEIDKVRTRAS